MFKCLTAYVSQERVYTFLLKCNVSSRPHLTRPSIRIDLYQLGIASFCQENFKKHMTANKDYCVVQQKRTKQHNVKILFERRPFKSRLSFRRKKKYWGVLKDFHRQSWKWMQWVGGQPYKRYPRILIFLFIGPFSITVKNAVKMRYETNIIKKKLTAAFTSKCSPGTAMGKN